MSCFWSWLSTELITVKEGNDKNDVVSWITIVSHSYNHIRSSPFSCRDMQQQWFNYLISDFQISKSVLIQKEYGVILRKLYFICNFPSKSIFTYWLCFECNWILNLQIIMLGILSIILISDRYTHIFDMIGKVKADSK